MTSTQAGELRERLFPMRVIPEIDIVPTRAEFEKAALDYVLPKSVAIRQIELAGLAADRHSAAGAGDGLILYVHGGGFCFGSPATHRKVAAHLCLEAGIDVLVPEYRLAPEHPCPAALCDILTVYQALLDQGASPSSMAFAGDSAGGALVIASLVSLRERGLPMPCSAAVISPWVDLTLSGESYHTRRALDPLEREPVLRRLVAAYAPSGHLQDWVISPLFADLRGLPPILIQVGDHEVLLSDAERLHAAAEAVGVAVTLRIYPDMWHVWTAEVPELPEASEAVKEMANFVRGALFGAQR